MSDAMHPLLAASPLLDIHHPGIESLVASRGWRNLSPYDRIGAVYDFVRNEIAFGYNEGDELPASRVLADGIGQCNTKSTLLMALLRAVGIPAASTASPSTSRCRRARSPAWPNGWPRNASFTAGSRSAWKAAGSRWKASSSMRPICPACSGVSRRHGASAATAPPPPTCRRRASSGAARTPTSRRKGSPTTSASSKAQTPSTRATAPTSRDSSAGCTSASSATA